MPPKLGAVPPAPLPPQASNLSPAALEPKAPSSPKALFGAAPSMKFGAC